jgi:hypothetical protein
MAVYVDELRIVGTYAAGCFGSRVRQSCHLMADTDTELEAMRKQLGLRLDWRHGDHYDLSPGKRSLALQSGVIEVTKEDLVRLRRRCSGTRQSRRGIQGLSEMKF